MVHGKFCNLVGVGVAPVSKKTAVKRNITIIKECSNVFTINNSHILG